MNQDIIRQIENEQLKTDRPDFRVGDTIRVYARIKEGTRERIQMFEGTVLKRQNGGLRETFTVRRMSYGVGVEKTWPLHSPVIDKMRWFVEVLFVERSCFTCVIAWVRLQRLRRRSEPWVEACKVNGRDAVILPVSVFTAWPVYNPGHLSMEKSLGAFVHRQMSFFVYIL